MQYRLVPVANYTELEQELISLQDYKDTLKSVIFLNCGGACDLSDFWNKESDVLFYVFDSHRPFWPSNVKADTVVLVDDSYSEVQEIIEEEDQSDTPGKRTRRSGLPPAKRFKQDPDPSGIFYGLSTAGLIYDLAKQMNRQQLDMLWLWIVGLTDQFIHSKIDKVTYEQRLRDCNNEIARLNVTYVRSANLIEDEVGELNTESKELGSITTDNSDFRLMLYRHWNLYDSLYNCNIVATKLGIWREPGRQKLNEMLAQIGIPLKECKQHFRYMNHIYRSEFRNKMPEIAKVFNLDDMFYTSCVRQYDRKHQFSAADVVYSLTAIMENPVSLEETELTEAASRNIESRDDWLANFWIAYDGLLDAQSIKRGAGEAIKLQQAIIKLGTSILEKKAIIPSAEFNYSIIQSDALEQTKFFHHIQALKKLAIFCMEAHKEQRSRYKLKPIVLAIKNSVRNTYIVCGVTTRSSQRK